MTETLRSHLPCKQSDHWRVIGLHLLVDGGDFDENTFVRVSGLPSATARWMAKDGDDHVCLTHGQLQEFDDEGEHASWILSLETRRTSRTDGSNPDISFVSLETILSAFGEATQSDVFVAASVDLAFPAGPAKWRTALLADPPQMTELREDLGSIELSGLTLRFKDSSHGLNEARLETSQDGGEYLVTVRFSESISKDSVVSSHEIVLSRAADFSSLFLSLEQSDSSEKEMG